MRPRQWPASFETPASRGLLRMRVWSGSDAVGLVKPAGSGTHDIVAVGLIHLRISLGIPLGISLRHPSVFSLGDDADGGVAIRRCGARLERFQDGAAALARAGAHAALGINAHQPD